MATGVPVQQRHESQPGGLRDSYPFVVPPSVVAKLAFVHRVIGAAMRGEMPMNFATADVIAPVLAETEAR